MMVLKGVPKRTWRRILLFSFVLAVLFTLTAIAQVAFVGAETWSRELRVLRDSARQTSHEVYQGRWDLTGYVQSDINPSTGVLIVTAGGVLIDFQPFVRGLIAQGRPPDDDIYGPAKTITTETGDVWLVAGRKLSGGAVVAGIANASDLKDPEALLHASLAKFGDSLNSALKVKARAINQRVDYAILDEFGDVRNVETGFPLKVRLGLPDDDKVGTAYRATLGGTAYQILATPIAGASGKPAGTVVTFDDIGGQLQVLEAQKRFVTFIAFVTWLAAASAVASYIVTDERKRRQQELTVEEALRQGEGQAVEFKEGIDTPDKAREVARTIAGFANSNPGNIFIGIKDTGEVVGVRVATAKEWDEYQKRIREIAVQMVDPPMRVRVSRFDYQGKCVVRIFVPRGDAPVYFAEKAAYIRDLTSVSRAGPDDLPRIFRSFSRVGA